MHSVFLEMIFHRRWMSLSEHINTFVIHLMYRHMPIHDFLTQWSHNIDDASLIVYYRSTSWPHRSFYFMYLYLFVCIIIILSFLFETIWYVQTTCFSHTNFFSRRSTMTHHEQNNAVEICVWEECEWNVHIYLPSAKWQ